MIAPFSFHYFKTGPESPERKYRIMLARGGIAIANALQEMAANAKTIPAPSRAEIAPGQHTQSERSNGQMVVARMSSTSH